jgi:hypothetical protein
LRCFDSADNLISVRRAMAVIMLSQQADGSWTGVSGEASESDDETNAATVYHTTMAALYALTEGRAQGFAPSIPMAHSLLEVHVNADLPLAVLEDEKLKKAASAAPESNGSPPRDMSKPKAPSNGSPPVRASSGNSSTTIAEESLEDQVRFHQGLLDKAGDNVKNVSAALAHQVLATLSGMKLNVDILKTTGVGRTINKLRKHSDDDVAKKATQLVAKWKKDLL